MPLEPRKKGIIDSDKSKVQSSPARRGTFAVRYLCGYSGRVATEYHTTRMIQIWRILHSPVMCAWMGPGLDSHLFRN